MAFVLMGLYAIALGFTCVYTFVQLHLAIQKVRGRLARERETASALDRMPPLDLRAENVPCVTVQLPVYNERYVVERLIDAAAAMEYPRDRFEIQLLDDSTDDSVEVAARAIARIRQLQPDLAIEHIRRPDRVGYKAGALEYGLQRARGEFIAIFDADFLPPRDFLVSTLPHFSDPTVAVVQTRWGHLNENYSLLTRLQALALDVHFVVEQPGRYAAGYLQNFNGTAGVWRRAAIAEAGGWEHDTLTEDIDLSYRAQLKKWRLVYREDVESPAELPADMHGFRSQQFRWTKGTAECARKLLRRILNSPLPLLTKVHAASHLLYWINYFAIFLSAMVSIPLALCYGGDSTVNRFFAGCAVFFAGILSMSVVFWIAQGRYGARRGWLRFVRFLCLFPTFVVFYLGLSLHNSIAGLEGWLGIRSPFIRTPKHAVVTHRDNWFLQTRYLTRQIGWLTLIEGGIAAGLAAVLVVEIRWGRYSLIPYHLMLCTGFLSVSSLSLWHTFKARAKVLPALENVLTPVPAPAVLEAPSLGFAASVDVVESPLAG